MISGEENADFTVPGSPLDDYLRTLELGEDNLFDEINSDVYEASTDDNKPSSVAKVSLKDCLKLRLSELFSTVRQFHSSQENGSSKLHSITFMSDDY